MTAPRQALELAAELDMLINDTSEYAGDLDGTPDELMVRLIAIKFKAIHLRHTLRAQAEADKSQAQIDLQEHFGVIRNVLYGARYVPQHLRALLDSPYNAQRERDTANGLGAALAQAGGDGQ